MRNHKLIPAALLFCLSLSISGLKAQTLDTAFAAVHYTFRYVKDTTKPSEVTDEEMVLYLGKHASVFKSYDQVLYDSARRAQFEKSRVEAAGGTMRIERPTMKPGSADMYYRDDNAAKTIHSTRILQTYLIEEHTASINWNMTEETRKIGELQCQKATASFRGRNYTVWFSAQLPYSNGPWKLGGLPGLIVEASDDKKEVVFNFERFEDVSARSIKIDFPPNAIKATEKEYQQMLKIAINDPDGFLATYMASSNAKINFGPAGRPANFPILSPASITHNPIEKSKD